VIALFKENEQFKQTRGLIELVSRLLKSVWERKANDVFLIGPQHFDLSIPEVRDKLIEISNMADVIAKDIWDAQGSAHAQVIDLKTGKDTAAQVSTLLLTASLSTAVNAVKGLTREEIVECLASPLREPSEFLSALEEMEKVAWYLHATPERRFYFDRQENLTKLLQGLAEGAPENQIDELIRHRLREMFKPVRKTVYDDVLPLPKLNDVADKVRRGRPLLILSPDTLERFFDGLVQKNNLCVLTGDKSEMASLERAARQLYAAQKADARIPQGHPQREELERRQVAYEHDFITTVLGLFDKLRFPIQRAGRPPQLVAKPLDMSRDVTKPFDGEAQIIQTLTSDPRASSIWMSKRTSTRCATRPRTCFGRRTRSRRAGWISLIAMRSKQGCPGCRRAGWSNSRRSPSIVASGRTSAITKRPPKKRTSAQVIVEYGPDDMGRVRLKVNPLNAGPAPRIHYAEDAVKSSPLLKDNRSAAHRHLFHHEG